MKKYKFGLSGVLRLRQLQEEQARAAMIDAERALQVANAELDHRLAEIGSARADIRRRTRPEFQHQRDQLERHALAVSAARAAEANALAAMRVARSEWEESAKKVRGLERMDERQRETWVLDMTRAAQQATDEVASVYFGRER